MNDSIETYECGLLNKAMWSRTEAQEAFCVLVAEDFTPGNAASLAELIVNGLEQNAPDLYVYCQVEAARTNRPDPHFVQQTYGWRFTADWRYYADHIQAESRRRQVETAMTSALGDIKKPDSVPEAVVEGLYDRLGAIPTPEARNDDTLVLGDILRVPDDESRWVFPKLLKENERLMLTGNEGGGKSMFVYQMLTGAAFGYDTLSLEETTPRRVMFIDVENNELQTKRNVEPVVPLLRELRGDVEPEWRWFKQRVINLLDTKDKANLIARVRHYAPEILYLGTVYKLTDHEKDENIHRVATAIRTFGDSVRSHVGCAMVVEHHSGHGTMNNRNNMRPEGSSQFMRWPDAGYGLEVAKAKGDGPRSLARMFERIVKLRQWRGDRFVGREWPVALRSGGQFPWTPIYKDEWEVSFETSYGEAG